MVCCPLWHCTGNSSGAGAVQTRPATPTCVRRMSATRNMNLRMPSRRAMTAESEMKMERERCLGWEMRLRGGGGARAGTGGGGFRGLGAMGGHSAGQELGSLRVASAAKHPAEGGHARARRVCCLPASAVAARDAASKCAVLHCDCCTAGEGRAAPQLLLRSSISTPMAPAPSITGWQLPQLTRTQCRSRSTPAAAP